MIEGRDAAPIRDQVALGAMSRVFLQVSLCGFGGGLALGMGLALWIELRDKAIRTEKDVEAVMDLPTLVSVPWLGPELIGKDKYGSNPAKDEPKKETVEV